MSERGYMNGVPLRLNTKFYPQPRPQFKDIDIHIPVDALQDEYDFSLERGVLREVTAWEENQKIENERRAEEERRRLEQEEEERRRFLEEEKEREREKEEAERLKDVVTIEEDIDADEVIRLAEELSKTTENQLIVRSEPEPDTERESSSSRIGGGVSPVTVAVNGAISVVSEEEVIVTEQYVMKTREERPITELLLEEEKRIAEEKRKWLEERKRLQEEEARRVQETFRRQEEERKKEEEVNSFKKYYFPLLSSMTASRAVRDRQGFFPNQNYNPLPTSTNYQILNSTPTPTPPYLTPVPSPVNPYQVLGSLSQPPSNHVWPGGTAPPLGGLAPSPIPIVTYPAVVTTPLLNGPLTHDVVRDANGGHPHHLPAGTSANSSHHSLL